MSKSKQKGTTFESLICNYLISAWDDRIVRVAQAGANDPGDIANFRVGDNKIAIECKNVARLDLSGWIGEARAEAKNIGAKVGIVIHKRRGKAAADEQYVTLTLGDLLIMLKMAEG